MSAASVEGKTSTMLRVGGAGSEAGHSKARPSGKTPEAWSRTTLPLRMASRSNSAWSRPQGSCQRLETRKPTESSK